MPTILVTRVGRARVRRLALLALLLALAAAAGACVATIDPVIGEGDAIFDPRLVGTWLEDSGMDRAVIARGAGDGYAIDYTSQGKTGRFAARLGRLGGRTVLDVSPAPRAGELPDPYDELLVAAHLPVIVDVGADEIRLALVQADSLAAAVRARSTGLTAGRSGDQLLLLQGPGAAIRAALGGYLARGGALEPQGRFHRAR